MMSDCDTNGIVTYWILWYRHKRTFILLLLLINIIANNKLRAIEIECKVIFSTF